MKAIIVLLSFINAGLLLQAQTKIAEVTLPNTFDAAEGITLVLNGGGIREKLWWDLYVGGLYLTQKSKDDNSIINSNEPMAVKMQITSSVITSERMKDAINEGFEKSTHGNVAPIKDKIDKLIHTFSDEIKIGDVFDLVFLPGKGVNVFKNKQLRTTIEGMDFKKALFGIWLSDDPVDKNLKTAMLGGN